MTDNDPIDRAALDRLQEWGGERLLQQMVRLFLENSPERVEQIRTGFESPDPDAVERGSHSLKSSAANVGAREVSRIAQRMEDAVTGDGGMSGARAHWDDLLEAHERACAALRDIQEEGAS